MSGRELPRPGDAVSGDVSETYLTLARRLEAFFAGEADDFADVELELEDGFYGDCARALRAVPRGEVVTYGELAALAGRPGAARAAGTFCARNDLSPFVPSPPRRRRRRDRLLRRARHRLQAPAARARGCLLSDELRDELAAIAPAAPLLPPRRALGALPHAGAWHLHGHGELGRTSTWRAPRPRGARSRCCATSACARRSAPTARHAFDRATRYQLHLAVGRGRARGAARGGRALGDAARRSSCRRSASSAARAAAARTCAARCSAPARCRARATRTSSSAPATLEGAQLLAEVAAREGVDAARWSSAAPTPRPTRSGRDDRRPARARRARARRRSASTSTPSSPRRAPTPTGSRTPTRRT